MSFTLIETKTLTSTVASFLFTDIPQTFDDLVLVLSLRTNSGDVAWNDTFLKPNSATTNLSCRVLFGNGSGAGSFSEATIRLFANGGGSTANTFSNVSVYLPNYRGTTTKSVSVESVSEGNSTEHIQALTAGLFNDTTAISSLLIDTGARSFVAGSTISLYGILKGSDGIVTTS